MIGPGCWCSLELCDLSQRKSSFAFRGHGTGDSRDHFGRPCLFSKRGKPSFCWKTRHLDQRCLRCADGYFLSISDTSTARQRSSGALHCRGFLFFSLGIALCAVSENFLLMKNLSHLVRLSTCRNTSTLAPAGMRGEHRADLFVVPGWYSILMRQMLMSSARPCRMQLGKAPR